MKLELWRPLIDLEKDWDALFHFPRLLDRDSEFPFRPSMDVARANGDMIVTAELPGIDPDKDLEITVDDDYLIIKGEKSQEKELTEEDRYTHERRFGEFIRRIPVPEGVDAEKISADYVKGILTVTVRLPEETAPKEPQKISVGSSA